MKQTESLKLKLIVKQGAKELNFGCYSAERVWFHVCCMFSEHICETVHETNAIIDSSNCGRQALDPCVKLCKGKKV